MNAGTADEASRQHYKNLILSDLKRRDKEVEYLLVLIDRYLQSDKAAVLARLYLAYLDGMLLWDELVKYAEIIDRFLPGDYDELTNRAWYDLEDAFVPDSLLRLISLGLVVSHENSSPKVENAALVFPSLVTKDYKITSFGTKLIECIDT